MQQTLWAPWRADYIGSNKPKNCVFCFPDKNPIYDEQRLILYWGKSAFVIMNKFPYNNGHIMVIPLKHIGDITMLMDEESVEIMKLLQQSIQIIRKALSPQGINVGLNLGEVAGSGILGHIHFHVVPRWSGDVSFMAAVSETRVISEHIMSTYTKLKPHFDVI